MVEDLEIFANELPNNLDRYGYDHNLNAEWRTAINIFKTRKGVMYFKADKGSSVVILNEEFYRFKMFETLKTDKYEKLPRYVDYFISLKLLYR